jgi:hypothetical protein
MSDLHRIRLREPWEETALENGRLRRSRRFGRPSRLDAHERVWLVVERLPESGSVRLNERELSETPGDVRCDVTELLLDNNRVEIDLPTAYELGEVCLEIG